MAGSKIKVQFDDLGKTAKVFSRQAQSASQTLRKINGQVSTLQGGAWVGKGANAFRLTKKIVETDIYKRTRNPMSLGYYLWSLSLGLITGSKLFTFVVLLGLIPAHIFFLKYFEEFELELRFGEAYRQYKQKVPFLFPKISP